MVAAKPWLLDVNVLLAIAWPDHTHHRVAFHWFDLHRQEGFRTCPITEMSFVRIASNARMVPFPVALAEAAALLDRFIALPEHGFWVDSLNWRDMEAVTGSLRGHKQITDAYLLALAIANGGRLATFDRGVMSLRGAEGVAELLV